MAQSPEQLVADLWSSLRPGWTVEEAKAQAKTAFAGWQQAQSAAPGGSAAATKAMQALERVLQKEKSSAARPHAADPLAQVLDYMIALAREGAARS